MIKKRECAECGRKFVPKRDNQLYHSKRCKNRAGATRMRERAKGFDVLNAQMNGTMGGK
jgi:hypothetical protein